MNDSLGIGASWVRNTSTSTKLISAFLFLCACLAVVGGIGIWGMNQLSVGTSAIADQYVPKLMVIEALRADFLQLGRDTRQALIEPDAQKTAQAVAKLPPEDQALIADFAKYQAFALSGREGSIASSFQTKMTTWLDQLHQMEPILPYTDAAHPENAAQVANIISNTWGPLGTTAIADLSQLVSINQDQVTAARDTAAATSTRLLITLLVIVVLATMLAMGTGLFISRLIAVPLGELVVAAGKVADGNLSSVDDLIERHGGHSEIGKLSLAFQQMITNLRQTVGQILDISGSISSASGQIAAAADQSGRATSQVAQTIQQVATGVQSQSTQLLTISTEMETLRHTGDQVATTAAETGQIAESSAQTINETLTGMQLVGQNVSEASHQVQVLAERSNAISEITTSIADLADQTNLLALNAAIEAARAGEHGRGFAVVADEVRKLAERSSMATKDITKIITEIQQQVGKTIATMELGVTNVQELVAQSSAASQALQRILTAQESAIQQAQMVAQGAERAMTAVSNAASVSEENSASAEEVSASTEEMAAQVEETATATQQIRELGENLREAVAIFQLDDEFGQSNVQSQRGSMRDASLKKKATVVLTRRAA
jgi:methyl-accepting chemotaxis protein